MKKFLNAVPLPITGIMLAIATFGNIMAESPMIKSICGIVSGLILLIVILKIILTFSNVKEDLKNPMIATTFSTFDMGIMVLSTYLKPFSPNIAKTIWFLAVIFHIVWLIFCIVKFLFPFNIKKMIPSFFIPFIGIAVSSITAPAFESLELGKIAFYFAFISLLVLTPMIIYRVFKMDEMPNPMLPSKAIIAAPASLCLAGYLSSFTEPNKIILYVLIVMAIIMSAIGLISILRTIKGGFFPSFSAFTFPMVISAMAMLKTTKYFTVNGPVFLSIISTGFYYLYFVSSIVLIFMVLLLYIMATIKNIKKVN